MGATFSQASLLINLLGTVHSWQFVLNDMLAFLSSFTLQSCLLCDPTYQFPEQFEVWSLEVYGLYPVCYFLPIRVASPTISWSLQPSLPLIIKSPASSSLPAKSSLSCAPPRWPICCLYQEAVPDTHQKPLILTGSCHAPLPSDVRGSKSLTRTSICDTDFVKLFKESCVCFISLAGSSAANSYYVVTLTDISDALKPGCCPSCGSTMYTSCSFMCRAIYTFHIHLPSPSFL